MQNVYLYFEFDLASAYQYLVYNYPETNDRLYRSGIQVDRCGFLYIGSYSQGLVYCIDPK